MPIKQPIHVALVVFVLASIVVPAKGQGACAEAPRLDQGNPLFSSQEQAFGFHDEEIVVCSPGYRQATHLAARLWVPASCPGIGSCPGVVIAHGYGYSKELTFADMLNAVRRGLYVISYDVRGQGASGGQADLLGREDIVDQAAVLQWFHREVRPTKTAAYGISQGGWLALAAAIFNCGAARAHSYGSSIPCDRGGRLVDAVAPVEGPTDGFGDGTCAPFGAEAFAESHLYPGFIPALARCVAKGTEAEQIADSLDAAINMPLGPMEINSGAGRVDVPVYLATSFADTLVFPNPVTRAYELLRARVKDPTDPYKKDLRLLISDEGHGDIGGNFAATDDIFLWIDRTLRGKTFPRGAPVAIAQEWAGDTFRLERDWPIPGSVRFPLYLSGSGNGPGRLGAKGGSEAPDSLQNVPAVSSAPGAPGLDEAWENASATPIQGMRLDFLTAPIGQTVEITNLPVATFWISANGTRSGQLHVALYEVAADGTTTEFSRGARTITGLAQTPKRIVVPLRVSDHRIEPGGRLLLSVMASDALQAIPSTTGGTMLLHRGERTPSSLSISLAPVARQAPPGKPPSGPGYTTDPIGAICEALALPC